MEEHALTRQKEAIAELEANRAVLRGVLLPHTAGDGHPDVFPRSKVMRFVLDSRKRRLAYGVVTMAWMWLGRRRGRRGWL
jgi:hypothetical protein